MCKCNTTMLWVCLFLPYVIYGEVNAIRLKKRDKSNEFDLLVFTQRWPPTVCFIWEEESKSHSCSLPKHDGWTIHGLWPTTFHSIGPEYCNKSLIFNAKVLAPIESQLREKWIDIQNGSKPYSFWKHEWDKHGTCAVTISDLDNEFKFFNMGLQLLDVFDMTRVLTKVNILPDKKYTVQDILKRIEKILGKRGQVMCTKDEKTGELYIFEIRICFDKTFKLMHCDDTYDFPTNCNASELITYPSHVPQDYNNYNVIQI